jgi:hypothetical protein
LLGEVATECERYHVLKKMQPRKFVTVSVGPKAIKGAARIELLNRYKLTGVVIKVHRLLKIQEPSAAGGHWIADLELLSARILAPATHLPPLSAETVRIIREHQEQERVEREMYKYEMQQEEEDKARSRQEELADKIIHDNEIAEEEKDAEFARQEALAYEACDQHDAQVQSENHDL